MSRFPIGTPGVQALRSASHNEVLLQREGARYSTVLNTIDGAKSRDPGNTGDVGTLRGGILLGKTTSGGKLRPAVIGLTTASLAGNGTSVTAAADTVTEMARLLAAGATTFKITGPPTAAGTVRSLTATMSAAAGTGITITALGVADVWTLTAPAGQDAGMYQLEVTTGKGTSSEVVAVTAALAANANTATVDAALEALANVGVGGVAAVYADPTLTLTFASNLGPVHVRVLTDTTNDGGVFEGGWAAVHTTTGVDGRFASGSLIQPADGAETIKGISDNTWGTRVIDGDGNSVSSVPVPRLLIGGDIKPANIPNYSSADASVRTWIKTALRAIGQFTFNDD